MGKVVYIGGTFLHDGLVIIVLNINLLDLHPLPTPHRLILANKQIIICKECMIVGVILIGIGEGEIMLLLV